MSLASPGRWRGVHRYFHDVPHAMPVHSAEFGVGQVYGSFLGISFDLPSELHRGRVRR